MRKGFKSLLTVAVTLLGFKAMAMAPVITNIPDVIIGDAENGASASNVFVFPQAFNVDNFVSDDSTTKGAIKWTYTTAGTHYAINGKAKTDINTDLLNPQDAYSLTGTGTSVSPPALTDDIGSTDSDRHTLTFRNTFRSPGAGPYPDPGYSGITTDSQTIMLIASDGSTRTTSNAFRAFILNNGNDQLSGAVAVNVGFYSFTNSTNGWVTAESVVAGGTVSLSSGPNGLCMDASAAGVNLSGWASQATYTGTNAKYNTVALTANAVYRLRTKMFTGASAGLVPMWRVLVSNTSDLYGASYIYFDNGVAPAAGNNSIVTRQTYTQYFTSPAVASPNFNAGIAVPANVPFKDFRVLVQTLDAGTVGGTDPYGAGSDTGPICLQQLEVDKYDITTLQVQSTPYNVTSIVQPVDTVGAVANTQVGAIHVDNFTGNNAGVVTYSGGKITIAPASPTGFTANDAFFQLVPGDGNSAYDGGAQMADNFPLPFNADELYRVVVNLSAPDANSATNPVDFIFVNAEAPTNDIIANNFITNGLGSIATPQVTALNFYSFIYTNGGTTATGNFKKFRPKVTMGTSSALIVGNNSGSTVVNSLKVEKVTF